MPNHRVGIRRECEHERRHHHGTVRAYIADKCRCDPCTDAHSATAKRYKLDKALNRDRLVPAAPVRRHIARLRDSGLTMDRIIAMSGRPAAEGIYYRLYARCQPQVARDICRVPIPGDILPLLDDRELVPAWPSVRRIQALARMGWTLPTLAARSGISRSTLSNLVGRPRTDVYAPLARKIAALYDDLWAEWPPPSKFVTRRRNTAAANGWLLPMEWDDIDDPDDPGHPAPDRPRTGKQRADETAAEAIRLVRLGVATGEALTRVGWSREALDAWARRNNRLDVLRLFGIEEATPPGAGFYSVKKARTHERVRPRCG